MNNKNNRRRGNKNNKKQNKNHRINIKVPKPIIKPTSRFLAMSKLLGIIIMFMVISIVVYSLYEMDRQNDLSSLPQLLISAFGIAGIYVGFYLNMAKWEHIEAEKTNREKEILNLKKELGLMNNTEYLEEQINELDDKIQDLQNKEEEVEQEEIDTNINF